MFPIVCLLIDVVFPKQTDTYKFYMLECVVKNKFYSAEQF